MELAREEEITLTWESFLHVSLRPFNCRWDTVAPCGAHVGTKAARTPILCKRRNWHQTSQKSCSAAPLMSLKYLHVLTLMSLVLQTARTVSRFLWRLVSTTHMVSWPFLIWDMASSSTSSVWLWFFTAWKYRHQWRDITELDGTEGQELSLA